MQAIRPREHDEVGVRKIGADDAPRIALFLIHANRAVDSIVQDDVHELRTIASRGGELLPVHEKAAIAVEGNHRTLGMDKLCGDRGGYTVAHAAARRTQLCAQAGVLEKTVHPY